LKHYPDETDHLGHSRHLLPPDLIGCNYFNLHVNDLALQTLASYGFPLTASGRLDEITLKCDAACFSSNLARSCGLKIMLIACGVASSE